MRLVEEFRTGRKIAVVSAMLLPELEEAPLRVREILASIPSSNVEMVITDSETRRLAHQYVKAGALGPASEEDALHSATLNHVDVLVSWNFRHIVNLNRMRLFNAVNLKYGHFALEIRRPREVINGK